MNNSCFEFCKKYGFNYLIPMNVSFSDPFNPLKSNKRPYKNFSWKDISKTIDLNSDRANEFVDCNVFGLLTEPNKLVVIDCDVDKELYSDKEHTSLNQKYGEQIGFNNLVLFLMERLNKSYSEIIPLIDTLTVITHTEGIHLYYRLTEEQKEPIQSNVLLIS